MNEPANDSLAAAGRPHPVHPLHKRCADDLFDGVAETVFYESVRLREMPLIAEEEAKVSVASAEMLGSEQGGLASA